MTKTRDNDSESDDTRSNESIELNLVEKINGG
jgi:hypothetical protein